MRVIYFTSSTTVEDFKARIKNNPTNPSNQHFHSSLIKAFSLVYPTTVVSSALPFKKTEQKKQPRYYYINENTNPKQSLQQRLNSFLDSIELKNTECLFAIDSLNYRLAKCARKYAKKHFIKTMGIITDNPHNISNLSFLKALVIKFSLKKYDTYFTLTAGLNKLANHRKRPSLTIPGCIDVHKVHQPLEADFPTPFLFFGGALYKKYGVKTLINAFLKSKSPYPLYIAGHGPLSSYIKEISKSSPTINFLGLIDQAELNKYIANALICINPRPFTDNFDRYAVPSKVIEYASHGAIIISTIHSDLLNIFGDSVFWISEDDELSLTTAINDLLKIDFDQIKGTKNIVANIVNTNFSIQAISIHLSKFIENIFKTI